MDRLAGEATSARQELEALRTKYEAAIARWALCFLNSVLANMQCFMNRRLHTICCGCVTLVVLN
jgi:hypothetical protein